MLAQGSGSRNSNLCPRGPWKDPTHSSCILTVRRVQGPGGRHFPLQLQRFWRPYTWLQLLPNCQQVSSPVDTGAQQEIPPAASSEILNGLPCCSSSLTAAVCQQTSQPSNPVGDTSVCTPGGPGTAWCLTLPPPSLSPGVVLLAQGTGGRHSCLYLWESLKRPSTQF